MKREYNMTTRKNISKVRMMNSKIQKEEKELARMRSKKMAAEVIAAQEKVVGDLKKQQEMLAKVEQSKTDGSRKDIVLTFSFVDEETLQVSEQSYKVAFVKNNRPINHKKVDGFITVIAKGKYEKAFPIIVASAKELIENGYRVVDVEGNEIKVEDANKYIVILDGQHRTLAFLESSITSPQVVPNTHIRKGNNIGEYLVDINDVGTSWNQQDRFAVAALVSDNELAQNIAERIDEKFNPTTASLIYTGKKISGKEVKKLLRGEEWTLPEGAKTNIERGNKFIQLCKEAGIEVKFITKRYFITGFNAYAESNGEEAAFEQLRKLKGENLTEGKLREIKDGTQFEKMLREVA